MRAAFLGLVSLMVAAAACGSGSGDTTSGSGGGGDGKVHPTPNGKAEAEAAACQTLVGEIEAQFQSLACVGTTRQCPDFVRSQFGACLEYDEGTVQGCADYYAMQTSCDALATAIDGCVIAPIDGSEGSGCP
ncbi:MAG TPA: hypothetical protein VHB21_07000 [Minicystis sp.]|nr:hypothetical protein [Minicystis sp.]